MKIVDAPFQESANYVNEKKLFQLRLADYYNNEDALSVLESSEDIPVSLKDIYVPLRLSEKEIHTIKSSKEVDDIQGRYIEDVLPKYKYLALSGLPGSGKSTLTKYLLTALADTTPNSTMNKLGRRLVIPIILREMDFSHISSLDELWNFWLREMNQRLKLELTLDMFQYYIAQGWAIIIFDGLDELGEETNLKLINWITSWLRHGITKNRIVNTNTYVIITARPTGFIKSIDYSILKKLYIQPFNSEQINIFVKKFFTVRYKHDLKKCTTKIEAFLDKLKRFEGLVELKHRPIYLSMLGYISEVDGELPQTRALAYSRMIEAYVHQLDLQKNFDERKGNISLPTWSRTDRIAILEELAYKIHTKADEHLTKNGLEGPTDKKQMQIQITIEELKKYFIEILDKNQFQTIRNDENIADDLCKYFLARTGLLIEPKEGFVQFSHLSFQEYLVASRIYRKQKKRGYEDYLEEEIFDNLDRTGWAEIAQLYFGIDSLRQGEEQEQTLHFVINENETSHQNFLYNLFFLADHKISEYDVTKWLKTILFIWITSKFNEDNLAQFMNFFYEVDKRYENISKSVKDYLLKCADLAFKQKNIFAKEDLIEIVDIKDKKDLANRLSSREQNINHVLGNCLLLGCHDNYIKHEILKDKPFREIRTLSLSKDLLSSLDLYIPLYPEKSQEISDVIFANMNVSDYIASLGNRILNTLPGNTHKKYLVALQTVLALHEIAVFAPLITASLFPKTKKEKSSIQAIIKNTGAYFFSQKQFDLAYTLLFREELGSSLFFFFETKYTNEKSNRSSEFLEKIIEIQSDELDKKEISLLQQTVDYFERMKKVESTLVHHEIETDDSELPLSEKIDIIFLKTWLYYCHVKAMQFSKSPNLKRKIKLTHTLLKRPAVYFASNPINLSEQESNELQEWLLNDENFIKTATYILNGKPYKKLSNEEAKKEYFDTLKSFTEFLDTSLMKQIDMNR